MSHILIKLNGTFVKNILFRENVVNDDNYLTILYLIKSLVLKRFVFYYQIQIEILKLLSFSCHVLDLVNKFNVILINM